MFFDTEKIRAVLAFVQKTTLTYLAAAVALHHAGPHRLFAGANQKILAPAGMPKLLSRVALLTAAFNPQSSLQGKEVGTDQLQNHLMTKGRTSEFTAYFCLGLGSGASWSLARCIYLSQNLALSKYNVSNVLVCVFQQCYVMHC